MAPSADDESSAAEHPFGSGSVERRLYDEIARTESTITAADLATRAECEPAAAREALQTFVALGIVLDHGGTPPVYERNDAHFEWGVVTELAAEHSLAALEHRIRELVDRIQTYQEQYGVDSPMAVEASPSAADSELREWNDARAELQRYERARQIRLAESDPSDLRLVDED